jgi:hypothetical protein
MKGNILTLTLTGALIVGLVPVQAQDEIDTLVGKVRAYLSEGTDLDTVKTLRYEGVLIPRDDGPERTMTLDLKAPNQQRLVLVGSDRTDIVAVDGYEGYTLQIDEVTGEERLMPLDVRQVRRMATNTLENLSFLRYPPETMVKIKDLGSEEFHGQRTRVLQFRHFNGLEYTRFIDPETGRIVGTRMDDGIENVEIGSQIIDGIRFGEEIHAYRAGELLFRIRLDRVEVNPDFPADWFRYPED